LDIFGGGCISQFESFSAITDSIFASGGCFLISKKWIENLGYLFDSHYFCYAEDVELSLRTILMGGRIGYVRDSRIQHYKGGSAPPSLSRMYLNTRNLLLTYYKLFTPNGFRRFFLARSILYSVYSTYAFMFFPKKWRKHIKSVSGVVGGVFSFLQDFGRYRDFRKEFLKRRLRDDEYIFRRLFVNGRLERLLKKIILSTSLN
jgi:GT2 family glycosyltransferase